MQGQNRKVVISVANNQKVNFLLATVEGGLESLGGKVDVEIIGKTFLNICGGMKPTKEVQIKDQWKHPRK